MCRWSVGAHSITTVPDTLWMEQRWGHPWGWPAIWSRGEQPSPLPTCTTETAWLMRMGGSTLLYVIFFLPHICCDLDDGEVRLQLVTPLSALPVSLGCADGAVSLSEKIRKASCSFFQLQHNFLWQDYPHPLTVLRQATRCLIRLDFG